MTEVFSYRPFAKVTAGLSPNGSTHTREWAFLILRGGHNPQQAISKEWASARQACSDLCETEAETLLRQIGLEKEATPDTVGAALAKTLALLNKKIREVLVALKLESDKVTLKAYLVELPRATSNVDFSGLVYSNAGLTLYELVAEHLAKLAAETFHAVLERRKEKNLTETDAQQFALGGQWSNGVLFCEVADGARIDRSNTTLEHEPAASPAQVVEMVTLLAVQMLSYRTDPQLQLPSAALAAAGMSNSTIEQFRLGTNRVREHKAIVALSPFALPRYDLASGTAFQANLTRAADTLFYGSTLSESYFIKVQVIVSDLIDEVLHQASELTLTQLARKSEAKQRPLRAAMKQALKNAGNYLTRVQAIERDRFAKHVDVKARVQAEKCVTSLSSLCLIGDRLVFTQGGFTDKTSEYHRSEYDAMFQDVDLPRDRSRRPLDAVRLLTILGWVRYGFPKPVLLESSAMSFASAIDRWKLKLTSITNPGPDRDAMLEVWLSQNLSSKKTSASVNNAALKAVDMSPVRSVSLKSIPLKKGSIK